MKVVGFIPIRKGSKGIPDKNIKDFCGKPLVYWIARAMSDSVTVEEVYIATDYEELPESVTSLPTVKVFHRSSENASDEASSEAVLLEFLKAMNFEDDTIIVFGQATSPLTRAEDIDNGVALFFNNECSNDTVISAVKIKRYFWDIKSNTPVNYNYFERKRRQDFEGCYMENGAFYINTAGNIMQNNCRIGKFPLICEMPYYSGFEIDELADWVVIEELAKQFKVLPEDAVNFQSVIADEKPDTSVATAASGFVDIPFDDTIPKLFITDVDGTLTDGGMYYSSDGTITKKFNTKDGFAVKKLHDAGCKVAIITSELNKDDNECVKLRAAKLNYDYCVFCEGKSKVDVAKAICAAEGITFADCGMVGDSENDFELLSLVGDAFCPADAHDRVKNIAGIVITKRKGGEGVLREITDRIYGL